MTIFNNFLNVLKVETPGDHFELHPGSQFAIGSVLTSKSFNFPNTLETKTESHQQKTRIIYIFSINFSNDKMFRVFDSFDTDETFHPFPPM